MAPSKLGKINPSKEIKGVLLDITGVLVESSSNSDGIAIQGSAEAVKKLQDAGI